MRKFSESMAWAQEGGFAIDVAVSERLNFIRKTYTHLLIELCGVGLVASVVMKSETLMSMMWPVAIIAMKAGESPSSASRMWVSTKVEKRSSLPLKCS